MGLADTESWLRLAEQAARAGGAVARARLGKPGYLRWKGNRDVMCEASLGVQETIIGTLLAGDAGAAVLAEEGPEDAPVEVGAEHLWIVDPICGSLNYAQGIPHFAVAVALRAAGRIEAGAVYNPCTDEMFSAAVGTDAMLNGRAITVEQTFEGLEAWQAATVGADWPCGEQPRRQAKKIMEKMADQVRHCPVMGSPALGLCYVAAGRLHAYWNLDMSIWDVAAASVILERAGATFSDAQGGSWLYSEGGYLATNGVVQEWAVTCLKSVLCERGQ